MAVRDETVSFSLEVNTAPAYASVRKLQTVLYRTLGLMRRMGLPPKLDEAIAGFQRMIAIANQARLAMIALQAASGPLGWAMAAIGVVATAVSVGEFLAEEG